MIFVNWGVKVICARGNNPKHQQAEIPADTDPYNYCMSQTERKRKNLMRLGVDPDHAYAWND